MIRRQRAYIEGGTSFAIETTLAGTAILRLMEQARAHGFSIHLIYIGINDVQATIDRIAARVARGGHNVPERDARRRYTRSLRHLAAAMERADAVTLIDNSLDRDQRAVLLVDRGQITSRADDMPAWVHIALGGHLWHSEVEPPDR